MIALKEGVQATMGRGQGIEGFWDQARRDLVGIGLKNPTESAIENRARSLMQQAAGENADEGEVLQAPGDLSPGAEVRAARLKAEQAVKREKHQKALTGNRFRLWVTILYKSPFAKKLRLSGCGLMVAFLNYQFARNFVFVNLDTLQRSFGADRDAIKRVLRIACHYGLVTKWRVENLSQSERDRLNSEFGIYKRRGWIYSVNSPLAWNWERVGGASDELQKYLSLWVKRAPNVDNSDRET